MAVRREKVVLEMDDRFSPGAMRAAAAAALLAREVESINTNSRAASSSMNRNAGSTNRYATQLEGMNTHLRETNALMGNLNGNGRNGLGGFNNNANNAGRSINQLTGRLRLFVDLAAMLGPTLAPIGVTAIPAITGLANQLGIAALAGGTAILAFQGVGDALKAVNEAGMAPTVANAQKAVDALDKLGPAARQFTLQLGNMRGEFAGLRDVAAEALFPGLSRGFADLEDVFARIEPLVGTLGDALGDVFADSVASLGSERWAEFFRFLDAEARPTLMDMAATLGDFTHGLSEMWMAFQPLNNDFSSWLRDVADGFDGWATTLQYTDGFKEFMAYIRESGPQVGDSLGAIGNAMLQVMEAMSPLGGPILGMIENLFDALAGIADSDIGTPLFVAAAAMAALSRATGIYAAMSRGVMTSQAAMMGSIRGTAASYRTLAANMRMAANFGAMTTAQLNAQAAAAGAVRTQLTQMGRSAATGAAGLGFMVAALTDVDDKAGAANTAMLGLGGAMIGGPWGAAAGVSIGAILDMAAANDSLVESINAAQAAFDSGDYQQMAVALEGLNTSLDKTADPMKFDGIKDALSWIAAPLGVWNGGLERTGLLWDKFVGDDSRGKAEALVKTLAEAKPPEPSMMDRFTSSIKSAADAALDLYTSLASVQGLLDNSNSLLAYERAIDAMSASLEENGNAWSRNSEAGLNNLEARNKVVESAISRYDVMIEQGDKLGAQRILTRAIEDLRTFAKTSPEAAAAMKPFISELKAVDGIRARAQVSADTRPAETAIGVVESALDWLGGKKTEPKIEADNAPGKRAASSMMDILNSVHTAKVDPRLDANNKPGMTAAQAMIAKLRDVDGITANPTVKAETASAQAAVNAIIGALGRIPRSITTTITTVRKSIDGGLGGAASAFNNVFGAEGAYYPRVGHYANGDIRNGHEAEVARGGTWRVWAEDETQGETYIPHANDHRRPRAKSILEQTAALFGGEVEWYAEGGSTDEEKKRAAAAKRRRTSLRDFDLEGDLGVRGVRQEMREFERVLRQAGIKTGKHFDKLGDRAEGLTKRWLKADKELDRLKAASSEVRSAASGSFNNDLFGNGLAGLKLQLEADRNDSNTMASLLKRLRGAGLDGALFDALSGSGDINTATQLLATGTSGINQYEQLYAQRAGAQRNLGNVATRDYSADIRTQTRVMEKLDKKLDNLEQRIEQGAYKGTKAGAEGKERNKARETRQRARGNR